MSLMDHLVNPFFKREIRAKCLFSHSQIRVDNSQEIARALHDEVVSMR